ncbi:proline-rich antigen homolog [Drosophila sechellia]|uniref:GM23450 n=1 Tax=Drosophila sechellia TaxID=7238 RepID=B4HHM5_DROSE|nr:proline-rich antigen homolog [Drosophila sechellia]EDW43567.1 GM23450 [Drosophila sechellia]
MQLFIAILVLILASSVHGRPTFGKIAELLFGDPNHYPPARPVEPQPHPGPGPLIQEGYEHGYDYHYGGGYGYGGYQQPHPAGNGYYPPRPVPLGNDYYPPPRPVRPSPGYYSHPASAYYQQKDPDLYGVGLGYKQRGY